MICESWSTSLSTNVQEPCRRCGTHLHLLALAFLSNLLDADFDPLAIDELAWNNRA